MADNIIQRIIKLILDRDAAKKTQDEMHGVAQSVEDKWKDVARKIAEFLGVAFLVEKMKEFGKEAVTRAGESEATWRQLKGTIDASGASFDTLAERINTTADAFASATVHNRDEFAQSLTRMTALTGDANASLHNMGLVANVAATFFKGDLEPAVNLVAKAMDGNVMMLQRMGIHAKNAQEALDILAQRSMGAATREAQSFMGQLKQLDNEWDEDVKAIGRAIIAGGSGANVLEVLRAAVKSLGEWVEHNQGALAEWVTNGVKFAIDATDVLIRAIMLVSTTLLSLTQTILGVAVGAWAALALAYVDAGEALIAFQKLLGIDLSDQLVGLERTRKHAEALKEWAKAARDAGDASMESAEKILRNPLFSSDQFSKAPPKTPGALPGEGDRPLVGKNMADANTKEVEKAIEEFKKAEKAAAEMAMLLGDKFDGVGAEIDRTTKLLTVLTGNGIDPAKAGFAGLGARLTDLVVNIKPVTDATKELAKSLTTDLQVGLLTSSTGFESATTSLDSLKARQADILGSYKKLVSEGVNPNAAAMVDLREQYQAYAQAIEDQSKIEALTEANKALAKAMGADMVIAALSGISSLNQLKQEESRLAETINNLVIKGVDQESDAFKRFVARYDQVKAAIAETEPIERTAAALRDFGDAMRMDLFMASLNSASALDKLMIEQTNIANAIKKIGIPATREQRTELEQLAARYKEVTAAIKEQTVAMQFQATIADFLADALGSALQGGLAKAAQTKAKQNAIEAAEMLVRAGVYLIFGDIPHATAAGIAAGQFTVLAGLWGAFAAAAGSGGGGSAPSIPSAPSAPSGGTDLSSSRATSSASSSAGVTPPAEVSIYLVGPGFDAMNPRVQEVVMGAQQQATERFGAGTRIRIRPQGG